MAVDDDLRRLNQLDAVFLSYSYQPGTDVPQNATFAVPFRPWYKGRLQQANDGSWIFKSISADGTIVAFELGSTRPGRGSPDALRSSESPGTGIQVELIYVVVPTEGPNLGVNLLIQIAQELPASLV